MLAAGPGATAAPSGPARADLPGGGAALALRPAGDAGARRMLSPYFCHYNFCRIHSSLSFSPAMAAGLTKTLHDMEWIEGLMQE